jgi:glycosyltransferase involved in cell wall biosynthesis
MDRICVLPPTDWGGYRRCLQRPGRVVGLAPLLPGPVNAARAPTRFFDITAAGAVGVYADSPVYASLVEHGQNGLLLPMAPELWVEQILTLLDQPKWRQMLHSGAVQTIFKD